MIFNIDPLKEEENTCIVMGYITILYSVYLICPKVHMSKNILRNIGIEVKNIFVRDRS